MALTKKTVAKGAGAIGIKQISTGRLLYLDLNSRYELSKTEETGDAVQGVNSDGTLVDLAAAGSELSFELTVASKKNTRNINELVMNSEFVSKVGYEYPWVESHTVAAGTVTLKGSTAPVAASMFVTYLDGAKLTSTGGAPAAGQFKDNGNGTITLNAADNGKNVVIYYKISGNVTVQGGGDNAALGDLEVLFHQVSNDSDQTNKKGVDILWLPKCSIAGDASLVFSNEVQDKEFVLKPVIPTTPAGWTVPYQWIRDVEIDNRNAG